MIYFNRKIKDFTVHHSIPYNFGIYFNSKTDPNRFKGKRMVNLDIYQSSISTSCAGADKYINRISKCKPATRISSTIVKKNFWAFSRTQNCVFLLYSIPDLHFEMKKKIRSFHSYTFQIHKQKLIDIANSLVVYLTHTRLIPLNCANAIKLAPIYINSHKLLSCHIHWIFYLP